MRRSVQRVVACVCCALTLHASAAESPKIAVVPFTVGEGASDSAVIRFGNLIADELKNRTDSVRAVPWPMPSNAPEKAAPKSTKPSAEAVAALEGGKKAYEAGRFGEASDKLKRGLELMLADPSTSEDARVPESLMALAVAAFRQGDDKEAQGALVSLARWDPKFTVPAGYPPVFGREVEKAKKKLGKLPKGSISIEGPAGMTAFVDGRDLGMVPVLDEALSAGPHYVRVEGPGGLRFGQVVDLKGGVARVKATFGGGDRPLVQGLGPEVPLIGPAIDEAKANRLAVLARSLGVEYLVVGWVYRTGEQELFASPALYSLNKKGVSAVTAMTFDADVLTANVEAYKMVDEIVRRVNNFGTPDSYPISLKSKPLFKPVSRPVATAAKDADPVVASKKPVQTGQSKLTPAPDVRALADKSTLVDTPGVYKSPPGEEPVAAPPSNGLPRWAWVLIGAGVAAGVGTGTYFAVAHANRPVTGTVTASW
ncbi:MAG: PEGA domain-containing protein [Myxococcaceae bacterium]|nr:PEGA domain-containing protein [Myxococcaceae bacterium]